MSDSSSSRPPYPSRKPGREPATIDLHARDVREEAPSVDASDAAPGAEDGPAVAAHADDAARESATPSEGVTSRDATEDSLLSQAAAEGAHDDRVAHAPPAPPPPPARRAGFAPLLVAAILGGLIGGGTSYLAERYWPRQRPADAGLQERVARIEGQTSGLARQDAVRSVDEKLGAVSGEVATLRDRLRAAEETLNRRPAPAAEGQPAAAAIPAAPDTRATDEFASRIAAVEAQLRERAQANASAAQTATQSAESATHTAQSATQTARTAAEQAQSAAQTAQALDRRLADLDRRVADVSQQATQRGADASATVRVAVSGRLVEALREGTPYAPVLASLRGAGVEPARLAALEPFAQTGAPTGPALRGEFAPVADRIRRETRPEATGVKDRFWRMLDHVVKVQPIGEAGTEGVPGLLARIDAALAAGAFKDAAAAWDALPEPARRISEDFGRRLKQRAAADEAARTLSAEALSGLEASTRSRS